MLLFAVVLCNMNAYTHCPAVGLYTFHITENKCQTDAALLEFHLLDETYLYA